MGERVGNEKIERENGYIYYVGTDGYVYRVPTRNNPHGKKARVSKTAVKREPGYLYYLDKNGYVARAKMKNYKKR
jgi:hypothetical protein